MLLATVVGIVYGTVAVCALANALFMKRPRISGTANIEFAVPARNEADRLPPLLQPLRDQDVLVTVFDDESSDATAAVARAHGAKVIAPDQPLPAGWRGKTRACHALSEATTRDWVVFLDADTRPSPDFVSKFSGTLATLEPDIVAVTGFPRMLPGRGFEPAYLFWVPWILLATNPFWLVSATKIGHNFFLNGQVIAWRRHVLDQLHPYELVKNEVLEDVRLGRVLASRRLRVEVLNLNEILSVQMYETMAESFQGMAKNSAEVVPGRAGGLLFGLVLAAFATSWVLWPPAGLLLLVAGLSANFVVRMPWWVVPLLPFSLLAGAWTAVCSSRLRRLGRAVWKGRTL